MMMFLVDCAPDRQHRIPQRASPVWRKQRSPESGLHVYLQQCLVLVCTSGCTCCQELLRWVGNNMKQFHLFTKDNMLTFTAAAKVLLHYVSCGKMCACYIWSPAVDNIALVNHAQSCKEIAQPGSTEDWQLSVHKIILVRSSKHSWYT